jgi:large subunit ribosomal protein L18
MKDSLKIKQSSRLRRKARTRAKIFGTQEIPRLSVFRSLENIYAQLIDDEKSKTLVSANSLEVKKEKGKKIIKLDEASLVGKNIAKRALEKDIKKCVFDRGGYKYHGRIKAVAEGAREGGLKF